MMSNLAIPKNLYVLADSPTQNIYLHCGKPAKIKKLEDNIGKSIEISGKMAIITYPLNFLVERGSHYKYGIQYSLEIMKNELLKKNVWIYEEGRIKEKPKSDI